MIVRTAMPNDVGLPGRHYNTWTYIAKEREGEDIAAVSDPAFWVHLRKQIRPNDKIEVLADTGAYEVNFRVIGASPEGLLLRETTRWESDGTPVLVRSVVTPTVGWGGPNHKWRVLAGDEVIKYGFATEAEANQHLADLQAGKQRQAA